MNELDDIRKRKLEEMQQKQNAAISEEAQVQQEIAQLEAAIKQRMTREAIERYSNIKAVDPEKAVQLLAVLAQLFQQGRLTVVDDNLLKTVLLQMQTKKKDFKITRK